MRLQAAEEDEDEGDFGLFGMSPEIRREERVDTVRLDAEDEFPWMLCSIRLRSLFDGVGGGRTGVVDDCVLM